MAHIRTYSPVEGGPLVQEQYQSALKTMGYVPNYVQAFSLRPEVYEAWTKLISAIRSQMKLRRYELVTFAAAMAMGCKYCLLAHASILRKNFFNAQQLISILRDFRNADLTAEEVALMAFAQKIVIRAYEVSAEDITQLRNHGISDADILDVILAATARSFFSKTLDAVGAEPDEAYATLDPEILQALATFHPALS
jgi:uncharacterized peroxidase-related enzyme